MYYATKNFLPGSADGVEHTNAYGGSNGHSAYGGTTHSNVYGGTTTGAAGYGAAHTTAYGATAYHPPGAYGSTYYGYHPPATVNYYQAGCYNCGGGVSAAGAALAGAAVGVAVGAAAASANTSAATTNAYAQGYNAGAVNTATAAYSAGQLVSVLPAGCATPSVQGKSYYLCGNTWFSPFYGASGVYYQVVPAP